MDSIWFLLYEWVVLYVLLLLGLFGSIVGTVLLSTKKMERLPARRIYRFLLITDAIFLTSQVAVDSMNHLEYNLRLASNIICKFGLYFNFSLCPISPWILVYISIDRYISICFKQVQIIRKKWFQNLMILLIIVYNLCFYIPFLIFVELTTSLTNNTETNSSSFSFSCDISREDLDYILYLSDLFNAALVPFILMLLASIFLVHSIVKSRRRLINLKTDQNRKKSLRDIHFAITILVLNFSFFIFSAPICLGNYLNVDDFLYSIFIYLFYLGYCINFYILAIFNSVFRKGLFHFFKCKRNIK